MTSVADGLQAQTVEGFVSRPRAARRQPASHFPASNCAAVASRRRRCHHPADGNGTEGRQGAWSSNSVRTTTSPSPSISRELLARIHAVLRRTRGGNQRLVWRCGDRSGGARRIAATRNSISPTAISEISAISRLVRAMIVTTRTAQGSVGISRRGRDTCRRPRDCPPAQEDRGQTAQAAVHPHPSTATGITSRRTVDRPAARRPVSAPVPSCRNSFAIASRSSATPFM